MSSGYLRTSLARARRPAVGTVAVPRLIVLAPLPAKTSVGGLPPFLAGLPIKSTRVPVNEQPGTVAGSLTDLARSRTVVPLAGVERRRDAPPENAHNLPAQPESPVAVPTVAKRGPNPTLGTFGDATPVEKHALHSDAINGFQKALRAPPLAPKEPESKECERQVANTTTNEFAEGGGVEVGTDQLSAGASTSLMKARVTGVQPKEFRVNWPEVNRALSASARTQAEREVIRAARAEFNKCTNSSGIPSEVPAVVNVRVENVTVKIDSPTPAPAPPPWTSARPTSAVSGEGAFSSYFLRRTISGF